MQTERIRIYLFRCLIISGIIFTSSAFIFAEPRIENVTFQQDTQDLIHIYYDLIVPETGNAKFYVSVKISNNNGKDFNISPVLITGDAGFNVSPGIGKHIIWEANKEYQNLKGDAFVFQISADDQNLPNREIFNQKDGASMILIPAGTFPLGAPSSTGDTDEHPQVNMYLDHLYIDKYEVTVAQFKKYCQETGASMPKQPGWSTAKHPVVNVSWEDAYSYTRWAQKRLPTEAEWEKAARGKSGTKYCFGDSTGELDNYAWFNTDGASGVGKKRPNNYDIFDMHGNVWEWCSDWYDENQYQKLSELKDIKNPNGPADGKSKVLRGGGWSNDAESCRVTNRSWDSPSNKGINRGFRCAKDIK